MSIIQQPTSFGQPSKEQKEQNLAIRDTDQMQETTTSDSAYFTKSHPKKPAPEDLPPVEPTPSNTHISHPETSSEILQNAVAVFNTPVYDLHVNSSPLQETLPSPLTLLNSTTLCFEEPPYAKMGPILLLFLTLVGPETIDPPPVETPPTKQIEYLTNEAVVTENIIPKQSSYQPNPIVKEPRYAKLAPVIKPFDMGLPGSDPGGGQETTSESFYDSEMAKYCTEDAIVTEVLCRR